MPLDRSLPGSPQVPGFAHSPRSPPIPLFEDTPHDEFCELDQAEAARDEDQIPYQEPRSEQTLLPPANFYPFFALVEDTASGEHYNPYIHYVFADDDPIIITAASMRSLGMDETKYLPQQAHQQGSTPHVSEDQEDGDGSLVESPLPPPIRGVKEHFLVIDVGADGRSIIKTQSLSQTWQITEATIRTAPSFDQNSPDHGYMLRVGGVGTGKSKGKNHGQDAQDKLKQLRANHQGDLFSVLDQLAQSVQGGLETAARISEPHNPIVVPERENDR